MIPVFVPVLISVHIKYKNSILIHKLNKITLGMLNTVIWYWVLISDHIWNISNWETLTLNNRRDKKNRYNENEMKPNESCNSLQIHEDLFYYDIISYEMTKKSFISFWQLELITVMLTDSWISWVLSKLTVVLPNTCVSGQLCYLRLVLSDGFASWELYYLTLV